MIYKCDYCKKEYDNFNDCVACEMTHMTELEKLKTQIHLNEEFLCDYCDHSYYVYGCELNCSCKECHGDNGFKDFKPVEPFHNKSMNGGI